MIDIPSRRQAFGRLGGAVALLASSAVGATPSSAATAATSGAGSLARLAQQLRQIPRKREFKTVPFVLTEPAQWDDQAARLVLAYADPSKQVWENSDIAAAWPNLMREAMNAQVFTHRNPDFLAVSATHGLAHLALFSQETWNRYQLGQLAGPAFASNTFIREKPGTSASDDLQDVDGFYGTGNNNIVTLQQRGAVFLACHDSIYAIARRIQQAAGTGSVAQIAADLTNGLVEDCVLVPSIVGFLVELGKAGFTYAKGS